MPKKESAPKQGAKRTQVPEPDSAEKTEASPDVTPSAPHQVQANEATTPQAKVSRGEFVEAWKDIRAHVKKASPNLEALLNSCKSLDVQGDALVLGLASEVLVEKIEKPEQIEITQKAINDVLGVTLKIRCVVTNAKGKVPADVDQNGLVAAAIQAGGEVVDIQE